MLGTDPFQIRDMRIAYARVSTDDQTLDLQRDALERANCRKIYEEHASGKKTTGPDREACLKSLRPVTLWWFGDLIGLAEVSAISFNSLTGFNPGASIWNL